ncbi:MAG: hypothetical protein GC164_06015 [Phycisphaera sp.]|nr:hypothetical protein [Phycisphaera sp.]
MSQLRSTAPGQVRVPARSNIYTVLTLIAIVALGIACFFVAQKSMNLTGEGNPFFLVQTN